VHNVTVYYRGYRAEDLFRPVADSWFFIFAHTRFGALIMFTDDELVPISALAQYVYCPRRAALLFLERQWADNVFTVEGRHVHQRAHRTNLRERLPDGYAIHNLLLKSERLGLVGTADVVEFHEKDPAGPRVTVVEYKRGKHKRSKQTEYEVQLCAQVICLEEMLNVQISRGTLFFAKSKHRYDVECHRTLRTIVEDTTQKVRQLFQGTCTPAPQYGRKCRGCSVIDICFPKVVSRKNVQYYIKHIVQE